MVMAAGKTSKYFQFDKPSTFTHIARNDRAVDWVVRYRNKYGFPPIRTILLVGSGLIEPFTFAANPLLKQSVIFAIDLDKNILEMAAHIKKGKSIPWSEVAEISANPGLPNQYLTALPSVDSDLLVLQELGSLNELGSGFNSNGMQIPEHVRNRVHFIQGDALEKVKIMKQLLPYQPDLVGDFFLQVNINKVDKKGVYTKALIDSVLENLQPQGHYLIGDTGVNLSKTLAHFAQTTKGVLYASSLANVDNIDSEDNVDGKRVITSHYLLASTMHHPIGAQVIEDKARKQIAKLNRDYPGLNSEEQVVSLSDLSSITADYTNLGYINTGKARNISWNIKKDKLLLFAKDRGTQFNPEHIIFRGQK
jgi:hypothetical protein